MRTYNKFLQFGTTIWFIQQLFFINSMSQTISFPMFIRIHVENRLEFPKLNCLTTSIQRQLWNSAINIECTILKWNTCSALPNIVENSERWMSSKFEPQTITVIHIEFFFFSLLPSPYGEQSIFGYHNISENCLLIVWFSNEFLVIENAKNVFLTTRVKKIEMHRSILVRTKVHFSCETYFWCISFHLT